MRDHDHLTGCFRGAAHKWCNIRLRRSCKIPVFFHNLRGYDGHIIALALNKFPGIDIRVIGQGMEKYLAISLGKYIVFKGSLMFLGSSLANLGKNLLASGLDKFVNMRKDCKSLTDDKLQLLMRKGVFPYDYIDSWERLKETQLPAKECFFNKLTDSHISDAEYEHAQNVWRAFNCVSLARYLGLYLMCMHSHCESHSPLPRLCP